MATLANCLKRAGKAIAPDEAEQIKQARQEYLDAGETAQVATEKAIIEMIRSVEADRAALVEQIMDKGGVVELTETAKQKRKPAKPRSAEYGKENKVFTADAAEKARELLRSKLGSMRSGLDPEIMIAGMTLAGYHIEAGARKFADYAKAMVEDLGTEIQPYIRGFYESVRHYPGFDNKGMSSPAEIDKFESENSNVSTSGSDLEPNSQKARDEAPINQTTIFTESGEIGAGAGVSSEPDGEGRNATAGDSGIPENSTDSARERSDTSVSGGIGKSGTSGSGRGGRSNAGGGKRPSGNMPRRKGPYAKLTSHKALGKTVSEIKKIIAPLQSELKGVPIEVVETEADLPKAVHDWAEEKGYTGKLQAIYHDGKAYVVANKVTSERSVTRAVLHEVVGHAGIKGVLGDKIDAVLDQIADSLNGKATLPNGKDVAKAYGLDWNDQDQRREIVEEYIAHLAETGEKPGFIRMVASKIRALLRRAFPQLKWTDSDILDLIAQSRKYVSKVRGAVMNGPMASLSPKEQSIWEKAVDPDQADSPDIRARLADFSDDYNEVAKSTIATPQAWRPLWQRVWDTIRKDYLPQSWKEAKQGFIDQFHSIEAMERGQFGELLDGSESAYKATLRTQNLGSVMEAVMQKGVLEYVNGGVRLKAGSTGFMEIFKGVHEADLMREWETWAAAKRASRLITEGKELNFNQAQIDTVLAEVDSKPAVKALFEQTQRDWIAFNKSMLDFAQSAGLIDPVERAIWEKDDYLPFHRINQLEDEPAKGPGRNKGLTGQKSGIQKLKGGVDKISPLESMVMNTTHLVDAAFRNIAMQRVADLAEQTGAMTPLAQVPGLTPAEINAQLVELGYDPTQMTPSQIRAWTNNIQRHAMKGEGIVTVSIDGKLKAYKVEDALLLRSISSMGYHGIEGVMKLFRGAKRLLTHAVTADPAFMIRNFIRDSLSTAVTVDAKITPLADAIRKMSGNEDLKWQLQAAGAGGGGFHDTAPDDVRAHLSRLHKGNKVIRSAKDAWEAWQKIGARFENANRLAVADKILKEGGTLAEAAHEAQDVLNFTKRGDYRAMQILIEMTPFLNARVQGLERLWRGAMQNTPEGYRMRKQFWMRGMIITAASMALLAANWDNDDYWDLPEWDRDTYYHFFVGDEHFRLPKPFEVGAIFSTIPERMFEQMRADADMKLFGERMLHLFQDTFAMAQVPQLFKPAYEVATNTNSFAGRPVVSYALQFVKPEAQYDPWTSETIRWVAEAMPDIAPDWMRSPKRLEHVLRGYVGSIGGYAVDMADFMGRSAFDLPETPSMRGRDVPIVKSFYQTGVGSTKQTDQLYQMAASVNELQSAIKKYREEGRTEKATGLQTDNMAMLRVRTEINRAVRRISELNALSKKILNAKGPPDIKRTRVDELQLQKQKIAQDIVEKYRVYFR